jgi:hypothetical protein
LNLYSKAKSYTDVERLEKRYKELRGMFRIGETKMDLDAEYVEEMKSKIIESVAKYSPEEIVLELSMFSMLRPLIEIRKENEAYKANAKLSSMLASSILDKFGNTVERFYSEEEIEERNLLQTYGLFMQMAIQTVTGFIFEAIKAKKLSFETIMHFLKDSWLNEPVERVYNGYQEKVVPLQVIEPGLKILFDEFLRINNEQIFSSAIIPAVDSLTLKVEYIFRFLCERLGIPTFKKVVRKNSADVIMERNIDDFLSELIPENGFPEDDKYFMKYILTEKSGWNLRNRVAHGLMDFSEYNFADGIGLLLIILRFGTYQFKTK